LKNVKSKNKNTPNMRIQIYDIWLYLSDFATLHILKYLNRIKFYAAHTIFYAAHFRIILLIRGILSITYLDLGLGRQIFGDKMSGESYLLKNYLKKYY